MAVDRQKYHLAFLRACAGMVALGKLKKYFRVMNSDWLSTPLLLHTNQKHLF
jgi:hypothetical protein